MSYGVIYKITNKETGECYIGKSINPNNRWKQHLQTKRFNPEQFTFEVIAEYKTKEDLDFMEKYWIWRFKGVKEGYNKENSLINENPISNKNISISEAIHYKLDVFASINKKKIKEVVEEAIEQYLSDKNAKILEWLKTLITFHNGNFIVLEDEHVEEVNELIKYLEREDAK